MNCVDLCSYVTFFNYEWELLTLMRRCEVITERNVYYLYIIQEDWVLGRCEEDTTDPTDTREPLSDDDVQYEWERLTAERHWAFLSDKGYEFSCLTHAEQCSEIINKGALMPRWTYRALLAGWYPARGWIPTPRDYELE